MCTENVNLQALAPLIIIDETHAVGKENFNYDGVARFHQALAP